MSKSLYRQLNKNMTFLSNTDLYSPANLLSSWTLLSIKFDKNNIEYVPHLEKLSSPTFLLRFDDWWNEIIFDDKKNKFTRKDVILFVANQDGGAHVDSSFDEAYAQLTKLNSLGWVGIDERIPLNNPAYQAIRAMANEFLFSWNLSKVGLKSRKKIDGKEFEMRMVDKNGRRYKWSTTEMTYSTETFNIVQDDKYLGRTLYIDEYKNLKKYKYIGKMMISL